jgi:hypothetical protein
VYKYAEPDSGLITGYPVEEIIGQKLTFLVAGIISYYTLNTVILFYRDCEVRISRGQPELQRWTYYSNAELSICTIRFTGQIATILTLRDISERIQTQRKIEALYQERRLSLSLQEEIDKRSKYTRPWYMNEDSVNLDSCLFGVCWNLRLTIRFEPW